MAQPDTPQNTISRALRMLSLLAQSHDSLRLGDIASELDMPKSSVHRIVTVLVEEGYVDASGNGFYQPGNGLRVLAAGMEGHSGSGIGAVLEGLRAQLGHTVFLAVMSGDAVTYTHKVDPELAYRIADDVGSQLPVTSAAGRAIVAFLPEQERRRLAGAAADRPARERALAQTRRRGFAIDYGETEEAVCSVAAPVLDATGFPAAAVAVSSLVFVVPRKRLESMAAEVVAAADEVARRL